MNGTPSVMVVQYHRDGGSVFPCRWFASVGIYSVPLKEMLPFLSRYLGHQSPDETFYYYHQVAEAFRIIKGKDKAGKYVIPEVDKYE